MKCLREKVRNKAHKDYASRLEREVYVIALCFGRTVITRFLDFCNTDVTFTS